MPEPVHTLNTKHFRMTYRGWSGLRYCQGSGFWVEASATASPAAGRAAEGHLILGWYGLLSACS